MEGDILTHFEADYLIQAISEIPIRQYGSPEWTKQHQALYKLNLQSHQNAKARQDEFVMDLVVTWDKVNVIIYDLIVSDTWKKNLLPLLKSDITGLSSIRGYMYLYHEGIVANFLQVLLYHRTTCQEAGDSLIDLINWCYQKIVDLTNFQPAEAPRTDQTKEQELEDQIKEINFALGISSISIIRFITDHLSSLTLSVIQQLVEQCDIFCVLVPLMESKPWIKTMKQGKLVFENHAWTPMRDQYKVPQVQAQIWLTIYSLFISSDARSKYELNSFRKNNLLRLRKFLNQVVIDQIPVLSSLLRSLQELSMISENSTTSFSAFLIQQLPQLANQISTGQNWQEIAEYQRKNFFVETEAQRKAAADLLMTGLEQYLDEPICGACGALASNRCSKCKNEWYCSRKCQVSAWKKHKSICALLAEAVDKPVKTEKSVIRPKIEDITNDN